MPDLDSTSYDCSILWGAQHSPKAVAFSAQEGSLSYADFLTQAKALAAWVMVRLKPAGLVVAVSCQDRWRMALLVHGLPLLGVAVFPLNPGLQLSQKMRLANNVGADLVDDKLLAGFDGRQAGLASYADVPALSPDAVQLILATSGSSGEPKAVMLTGANLMAAAQGSQRLIPVVSGDCWLNCLPLYHIGGLSIFYRCFTVGAKVLLHESFDAEQIWRDIQQQAITQISLVPVMLSRLLAVADGQAPRHLKAVLVGGGPLDPALAKRAKEAGWPLCVSYGMSETASQVASYCGQEKIHSEGFVGQPLPGVQLHINPSSGEIQVKGPMVMAGYANAQFQAGDGLSGGWFATGDMGFLGADGFLHVQGRIDDGLNSGGVNISPVAVEQALDACVGIDQAAVTARSDPEWGDSLVAYYIGSISPDELDTWSRRHLADSVRPRCFIQVQVLPINAMGKLIRHELREWAECLPR